MNLVATSLLIIFAIAAFFALEISIQTAFVRIIPSSVVETCNRVSPAVRHAVMGAVLGILGFIAATQGSVDIYGLSAHNGLVPLVCAGLLFGPIAGISSGLALGICQFFDSGGWMSPVLGLTCFLLIGALAGFIKRKIVGDEEAPFSIALAVLLVSIAICQWISLFSQLNYYLRAMAILAMGSDGLILSNTLTLALCFYIVRTTRRFSEGMNIRQALSPRNNSSSQTVLMSFRRRISVVAFLALFTCTMVSTAIMNTASFLGETDSHRGALDSVEAVASDAAQTLQDNTVTNMVAVVNSWSVNADDIIDKGSNGFAFIVLDYEGNILSEEHAYDRAIVEQLDNNPRVLQLIGVYTSTGFTETPNQVLAMPDDCQDYRLVVYSSRYRQGFIDNFLYLLLFSIQSLIFLLLVCAINLHFRRMVSNNLEAINNSLSAALSGRLEEKVQAGHNREFDELARKLNDTIEKFKHATEKKARYESDIELAHQIQMNALPQEYPAFPDHTEFELYACYRSAQQVGGDFYDYFLIDHQRLAILIADVSGKGIPAALFMMRAKMALQAFSRINPSPSEILSTANNYLCENNSAGMFVTCWLGILDTTNGELNYASAGHDAPYLVRAAERCRTLPNANGIMLGFVEHTPYTQKSIILSPGDMLYLYTDGVTETKNGNDALFGKARLRDLCSSHSISNSCKSSSPNKVGDEAIDAQAENDEATCSLEPTTRAEQLCLDIIRALDDFAGDTEQFDDITMLALEFFGDHFSCALVEDIDDTEGDARSYRLSFSASVPNVAKYIERMNELLEENHVPSKTMYQADMIADELLSNIVRHGKLKNSDSIEVLLVLGKDVSASSRKYMLRMTISDPGHAFNPLEHNNPNTNPSLSDAHAGGVGIHIVKRAADVLSYSRNGNRNVLTVGMRYLPLRR